VVFQHIEIPDLFHICAPCSELPSSISAMRIQIIYTIFLCNIFYCLFLSVPFFVSCSLFLCVCFSTCLFVVVLFLRCSMDSLSLFLENFHIHNVSSISCLINLHPVCTVCPKSLDPFYIVSYFIILDKTS